ncbi:hypothetical protein GPECTOR_1240g499 [Gonium pectorale]|uniref:F-box domain-containing protein n=1 Tax=Gonium pectorale TaxID=33097 RepID=A0A150FTI7_GONPE|nr:hypothetical protein GPECTOR_1240g499 [Gonium pectorale]|eukprot:KXZ40937.1 hypothetical protein GPECTOR_1240g499 [Gonium pectorale]
MDEVAAVTGDPQRQHHPVTWNELLPELQGNIMDRLDPNDRATVRCVDKTTAARFRKPEHVTIHLSQPVAAQVFAAHWLAPGAIHGLTLERWQQLLCLVAASGSVANLQTALDEMCPLTYEAFEAAAAKGHLASCQRLLDAGCLLENDG